MITILAFVSAVATAEPLLQKAAPNVQTTPRTVEIGAITAS